jgi:hypothetical protein
VVLVTGGAALVAVIVLKRATHRIARS